MAQIGIYNLVVSYRERNSDALQCPLRSSRLYLHAAVQFTPCTVVQDGLKLGLNYYS